MQKLEIRTGEWKTGQKRGDSEGQTQSGSGFANDGLSALPHDNEV